MNALIINSHPYEGSFNRGAVDNIKRVLGEKGECAVIDLIGDGFDPVMRPEDLRLWGQGQSNDPLVKRYQDAIDAAEVILFPFPVWWGAMPAVLKGFCDKVLLAGWAYRHGENGEMVGLLTDKKAVVITTMQTPVDVFHQYFGDPIEGAFIKDTLMTCGFDVLRHIEIDNIVAGGQAYAQQKMDEVIAYVKTL